jgi:tetratricopeptide (TPR) repeat protein
MGGVDDSIALTGLRIAITGRLASMTRSEVEERLRVAGAETCSEVDETTDLLVVGQGGWPLAADGQPTRALREAESLRSAGKGPQVIDERRLLTSLGLAGPELQAHYTTDQLARILDVPPAQLRAWVRAGLIRPARVVRRMWTFDFREVASARSLHRLLREGAKPAALARGLEQLERWLPDARRSLGQLATLEKRGDLLVRTRSGKLAEPNGQLRLFAPVGNDLRAFPAENEDDDTHTPPMAPESPREPSDDPSRVVGSIPRPCPEARSPDGTRITPIASGTRASAMEDEGARSGSGSGADSAVDHDERLSHIATSATPSTVAADEPDLLDAGLALERAGRPAEAAAVYRTALDAAPDRAELWFNLGNVLYGLIRVGEAVRALETAVDLDPCFVEAWNNLGNAYAESGRSEQAIVAWRRAVALDPGCADAHFNLAQELDALERDDEARRHALTCLELLPDDAPEAVALRRLAATSPEAVGWHAGAPSPRRHGQDPRPG